MVNALLTFPTAKLVSKNQTESQTLPMSILETAKGVVRPPLSLHDGSPSESSQNLSLISCEHSLPLTISTEKSWQLTKVGLHLFAVSEDLVSTNNVLRALLCSHMQASSSQTLLIHDLEMVPWINPSIFLRVRLQA